MIYTVPVQFSRFSPRVDGSYSLSFVTSREMSRDEVATFADAYRHEGILAFAEAVPSDDELAALANSKPDGKGRTPSRELRAVLYRLWQETAPQADVDGSAADAQRILAVCEAQKRVDVRTAERVRMVSALAFIALSVWIGWRLDAHRWNGYR